MRHVTHHVLGLRVIIQYFWSKINVCTPCFYLVHRMHHSYKMRKYIFIYISGIMNNFLEKKIQTKIIIIKVKRLPQLLVVSQIFLILALQSVQDVATWGLRIQQGRHEKRSCTLIYFGCINVNTHKLYVYALRIYTHKVSFIGK